LGFIFRFVYLLMCHEINVTPMGSGTCLTKGSAQPKQTTRKGGKLGPKTLPRFNRWSANGFNWQRTLWPENLILCHILPNKII